MLSHTVAETSSFTTRRRLRLGNMLIYKLATVLLVLSLTAAARPHSPGVRVLAVAKEYALQHGIRSERVLIVGC